MASQPLAADTDAISGSMVTETSTQLSASSTNALTTIARSAGPPLTFDFELMTDAYIEQVTVPAPQELIIGDPKKPTSFAKLPTGEIFLTEAFHS